MDLEFAFGTMGIGMKVNGRTIKRTAVGFTPKEMEQDTTESLSITRCMALEFVYFLMEISTRVSGKKDHFFFPKRSLLNLPMLLLRLQIKPALPPNLSVKIECLLRFLSDQISLEQFLCSIITMRNMTR